MEQNSVQVCDAFKYYGSTTKPSYVLKNFNMTVKPGSIYALLGSSGCGKTTILLAIMGLKQLNKGDIKIFGQTPVPPGGGVSARNAAKYRIGWMPQETALTNRMTIKELIYYFGRIHELPDNHIDEKYVFLKDLLKFPSDNMWLKDCSGGEQRRISFACALVNDPDLLILDEPTVGLDPLLRENIWNFLIESTRSKKMTVLLTTHHVEEARSADFIGIMRNGIILVEDTPENLMNQYETDSIETVCLKLSQHQDTFDSEIRRSQRKNVDNIENKNELETNSIKNKQNNEKHFRFTTFGRLKALLIKNWIQYWRNYPELFFNFVFPLFQLGCFYLAIGRNFTDIKIGIFSEEINNMDICFNKSSSNIRLIGNHTCIFENLSCRFIKNLENNIGEQVFYNSLLEAEQAFNSNHVHAYVTFFKNYSKSFEAYLKEWDFSEEYVIDNAQIPIYIDRSNQQVALYLQRKFLAIYHNYVKELMVECNFTTKLLNSPIVFEESIYGSVDTEFQKFMEPGLVLTIMFFLTLNNTLLIFFEERNQGVWNRSLIASISPTEMLMSHFIFQVTLGFLMCIEVFLFITLLVDHDVKGNPWLLFFLLCIFGVTGIVTGFLIGTCCNSTFSANSLATALFYPIILLCGMIWPHEAIVPLIFRKLVLCLPFTVPVMSARNIIDKAWDLTHPEVYNGFLIILAWLTGLITLCIISIRKK